jgi:uncharacterized membrane protein
MRSKRVKASIRDTVSQGRDRPCSHPRTAEECPENRIHTVSLLMRQEISHAARKKKNCGKFYAVVSVAVIFSIAVVFVPAVVSTVT